MATETNIGIYVKKSWYEAVETITPHVVRILTPHGSGTGFLFYRSEGLIGLATAAHVIEQCHFWEDPIRILHSASDGSVLFRMSERAVFLDSGKDTAAIVIPANKLTLPSQPFDLVPEGRYLKVGNEIGWLGFPAVASTDLCFFGGRISAWKEDVRAYLVDGVAINGVSGGPAFHTRDDGGLRLLGVVSAYIPNRATGDVLPGLAVVRDVTQFHKLMKDFKSLEEAKEEETPPVEPSKPPSDESKPDVPTTHSY